MQKTYSAVIGAQVSNKKAESCGSIPWWLCLLCLLFSAAAVTFPFIRSRLISGTAAANPALYPGLGSAFRAAAAGGGGFSIQDGKFIAGQDTPEQLETQFWLVRFGDKNPQEHISKTERVLIFGEKTILISVPENGPALEGSYRALEGLSSGELQRLSAGTHSFVTWISAVLFALATENFASAAVLMFLLMLVQNILYLCILGLFLFFLKPGSGSLCAEKGANRGLAANIKITVAAAMGPSLITALSGVFFPSFAAVFGWLMYSLLLGLRIVCIGLARKKNCRISSGFKKGKNSAENK